MPDSFMRDLLRSLSRQSPAFRAVPASAQNSKPGLLRALARSGPAFASALGPDAAGPGADQMRQPGNPQDRRLGPPLRTLHHYIDYLESVDDFAATVNDAIHGDDEAMGFVLEAANVFLIGYCRAYVGLSGPSFTVADEVAHDACERLIAELNNHVKQRNFSFIRFARDVANATVEAVTLNGPSGRRARTRIDQAAPDPSPVVSYQIVSELREMLSLLPADQLDTLVLRVVNGLSAEETALAVGSSPGGVRVSQHLALERLRKFEEYEAILGKPRSDRPLGPNPGVGKRLDDPGGIRPGDIMDIRRDDELLASFVAALEASPDNVEYNYLAGFRDEQLIWSMLAAWRTEISSAPFPRLISLDEARRLDLASRRRGSWWQRLFRER